MRYRRFGRTNIQMPVFSCGGMRYQFKWQDVPFDQVPQDNQANLEATIRRSVEVGINHIETARGYGSSERQLGYVLPTFPRDQIIVQTKIAPNEDPKAFVSQFNESLERLQLDYVDLLSLHGVNNPETLDWSLRDGGCLAAGRELQKQGKARWIGFSTHGLLEDILTAVRHDKHGGFDYVNLHWYYIYQRNWPAIEEATQRDMGVFIISPSDKGGKLYAPPKKLEDLCRPLHPMIFNDLFCLRRPEVHTLSLGAARPSDFVEHLEATSLIDQAEELVAPIVDRLDTTRRDAVGDLLFDPLTANLPDWHSTPGDINIPIILWLRTLAIAYDMTEYGKMRYNLLGNGGHWFPGLNAESLDAEAIQQTLADHPLANQAANLLRDAHDMLKGDQKKRQSESD